MLVIVLFTFFVSIFWAGYEQGGGLMNLFTARSPDRQLLGHEIPTTWFQAVNSDFIFFWRRFRLAMAAAGRERGRTPRPDGRWRWGCSRWR